MLLYRPLDLSDNKLVGFELAMAIYSFLASITGLAIVLLLKKTSIFSDKARWTFAKELTVIFICLSMMSLVSYAAGFVIENTGDPDFLLSAKFTFLLGILPYAILSLRNFPFLFPEDITIAHNKLQDNGLGKAVEEKIYIESKLKSESLSFYPSQFIFAESEGNYVTFYFDIDNKIEKSVIRNSISDIETQLSPYDIFFRTHRAFIVNTRKVKVKSGNVLGYRLKLLGIDKEVPVSRQNTKRFDEHMEQEPTKSEVLN